MGQDEVSSLRLLGLLIDNKLTYETHAKIVCGRLVDKLRHLERLKPRVSFKMLKEVTTSLIHNTIEFCAEIYLRSPKNQKLVQKKLNSTMRIPTGSLHLGYHQSQQRSLKECQIQQSEVNTEETHKMGP